MPGTHVGNQRRPLAGVHCSEKSGAYRVPSMSQWVDAFGLYYDRCFRRAQEIEQQL